MFVCAVAWWTAGVCMALRASRVQTNTLAIALSTTLYIARWREQRCNPSKNPLVYAGMVRGLMVLLLYPGGVAGMLLGMSRWPTRLLRHMLETLQSRRAPRLSERRQGKLRSTMNCAATTLLDFKVFSVWPWPLTFRGHQRSKIFSPFESPYMTPYLTSIDTFSLSRTVFEIFDFKVFRFDLDLWPLEVTRGQK